MAIVMCYNAGMEAKMTTTADNITDVILTGEQQLPEAAASINVKLAWNGGDIMLTLRGFDEKSVLERLVAIMPTIEELGMTVAERARPAKAAPATKATPKKATPIKEEEEGEVDEVTIDIDSIYVHQGPKRKVAFVKGSPGYEKEGAIAFDDAFKGSGYDLQSQTAGQRYEPDDFGFVRAVIRIENGKARVWRFLTEREKIPF